MAETTPTSRSEGSHFLIPGDWAVFPRLRRSRARRMRQAPRPSYTPLQQERPSWTGSVVAFMQKGREIVDLMERQMYRRRQSERKLAELAAKRTVKKLKP